MITITKFEFLSFDNPLDYLKYAGYEKDFSLSELNNTSVVWNKDKTYCIRVTTDPDSSELIYGIFKCDGTKEILEMKIRNTGE